MHEILPKQRMDIPFESKIMEEQDDREQFPALLEFRRRYHATGGLLPPSFHPKEYTVLCGRGSVYSESTGNNYLKLLVQQQVQPYGGTSNRAEKSRIVTSVVNAVHQLSPEAAFVNLDNGTWKEMKESLAREKVGGLFRDLLHNRYKSSNKAKVAKRSRKRLEHLLQTTKSESEPLEATGMELPFISDGNDHTHISDADSVPSQKNFNGFFQQRPQSTSDYSSTTKARGSVDVSSLHEQTSKPQGDTLPTASFLTSADIFEDKE